MANEAAAVLIEGTMGCGATATIGGTAAAGFNSSSLK